jgi:hypothetical protein
VLVTASFSQVDVFLRNNYWVTGMEALLQDNICCLDLNQAQRELYQTFPTKKISLFRTNYTDIQYYLNSSVINLLFSSSFPYSAYSNSYSSYTTFSSALEFRVKPRVNTEVTNMTTTGNDFIASYYQAQDYLDVIAALNQLLSYRQGLGYTPVISSVPLVKMINQSVDFEQTHNIPSNYSKQSTNLIEALFELRLFKTIADYAISVKIMSL